MIETDADGFEILFVLDVLYHFYLRVDSYNKM